MKMSIAVTALNQIEHVKKFIESIEKTTDEISELIILDNGSTEDVAGLTVDLKYPVQYIRNDENVGLFSGYNQIIKASKNEWVAIFHNDIVIHEKGWDTRVKAVVDTLQSFGRKIGIVGFAGGNGLGADGARLGFMSNLRDVAEIHGRRMTDFAPAIVLDGCVLIMNKKMLEAVGGFDELYKVHHIYDYDISIASIKAGFYNLVVGIDFTHEGGITACAGDFQIQCNAMGGEQDIMNFNMKRWAEKWGASMPIIITDGWKIQ